MTVFSNNFLFLKPEKNLIAIKLHSFVKFHESSYDREKVIRCWWDGAIGKEL